VKGKLPYLVAGLFIVVGLISLIWWLLKDPTKQFTQRLPGMDHRGSGADTAGAKVVIGENFKYFADQKNNLKETWPRFRGEYLDNISRSPVRLIDKFGPGGPDIKWSVDLGEGHAGAAIYAGAVYVLDYDETLRSDMLRCFDLTDGTELWRRWYHVSVKRNHGMSRTVPAVTDKYVVSIGPRGHVMCVDRQDGNFRWGIDIEKQFKSEIPLWYTGQCPLIDGDKAIIATGGDALLIAVDCTTGDILWKTPNPDDWKMSHSSVMIYNYGGRKMYVYSAFGGIAGIAADGDDAGTILWNTTEWNHQVVAPSPVCMPDGKIFLTAGYGAGSMMLQLSASEGKYNVKVLQVYPPKDGLACEQQTPLYLNGHLFGIEPKDAGALRNQLVCVDPADVTKIVWSSGQTVRFGLGPYMIADNKMFILNDEGVLTIVKPSVKEYIQLDQAPVMEGQDAWAPLAVADGYMVLRDSKKMMCIDLRKGK
jgi:outer membrane protein assembly factor BamB